MFKNIRSIIKIFFFALLTVVIAGIFIKLDYSHALSTSNSDDSTKATIQIYEGETVDQILQSLVDNGIIRGKWITYTKIYLRINDLASKLQAGTYELPKNLSIKEVVDTLQSGKNPDIWVTIPEGLRKDEVADIYVREIYGFSKNDFLSLTTDIDFINTFGLVSGLTNLEGYLFPDKYAFSADTTEEEAITRMVENFKTKVGTADSYADIIFASIVEREGFDSTDRPIIAGIVMKRYEEGWTLGLSTTILYSLKSWDEEIITADNLASDDPYNTYKKVGLPPTPICNPGLEAINAVRNPVETEYYYFIRGNDNVTHYGVTYDDHLQNIANYLN